MIQVVLCTVDQTLAARLREAIGDAFLQVAPLELPRDTGTFAALLAGAGQPDIAIIDSNGDDEAALELAADLSRRTQVQVILISPAAQEIAFGALRAGVRDVLHSWATPEELRAALDRTADQVTRLRGEMAAQQVVPETPTQLGRVITVTSPKGGVGKTTVATNLAVGLAQRAPQQVVLVDADVHFGDVASALNLTPQHTLPDIARGPAAGDSIAVKSYLTEHGTGLYVIPGSESPAAADQVTPADLGHLLELLRSLFAFVVVDTAPGLTEHTLAVLDRTDSLVLVTSLDVPGVRGLRKEIDTLADLRMVVGTRHIVVNFHDNSRGLSIADVEATIRAKVDVVMPVSTAVPLSTNQGIPLVQSGGRDPVTRNLRVLVDAIAPLEEPQRSGFLKRGRR